MIEIIECESIDSIEYKCVEFMNKKKIKFKKGQSIYWDHWSLNVNKEQIFFFIEMRMKKKISSVTNNRI